jgi:hypothetical protein
VALFSPVDPREEKIDCRSKVVFANVEVPACGETYARDELPEFGAVVLLKIEPEVRTETVHQKHLGSTLPIARLPGPLNCFVLGLQHRGWKASHLLLCVLSFSALDI